jgi:hypothetical protein
MTLVPVARRLTSVEALQVGMLPGLMPLLDVYKQDQDKAARLFEAGSSRQQQRLEPCWRSGDDEANPSTAWWLAMRRCRALTIAPGVAAGLVDWVTADEKAGRQQRH